MNRPLFTTRVVPMLRVAAVVAVVSAMALALFLSVGDQQADIMTTRTPLVLIGGKAVPLPAADSLSSPGGFSGIATTTCPSGSAVSSVSSSGAGTCTTFFQSGNFPTITCGAGSAVGVIANTGVATCVTAGTGTTTGTGTANTTAKWTGASALGNAWPLDDGTTWGVGSKFAITEASGNTLITGTLGVTGQTTIGAGGITGLPATTCGAGSAMQTLSTAHAGTCAAFGTSSLTNAAGNNIVTKSNGTNLVASSVSDDATTFAVNTNKFTITESSGNTAAAGTLDVTGRGTFGGITSTSAFSTFGDLRGTEETITSTGTVNDLALGASTTILRWNGASTATFTGIAGGVAGRILIIENVTANTLFFAHQSGLSSAGNKLNTLGAISIATNPTGGGTASIIFAYDGTTASWRQIDSMSSTINTPVTYTALLTVSAAAAFSATGTITTTKDIILNAVGAHLRSVATVPLVPTSCGTSPSATLVSDAAGHITIGATGTGCTIPWAIAYGNVPSCVVTFESASIAYSYAPSTTNLVVTAAAGAGLTFDYICMGDS